VADQYVSVQMPLSDPNTGFKVTITPQLQANISKTARVMDKVTIEH